MRSFFGSPSRFKSGLHPGILCALFVFAANWFGLLRGVERISLDALFRLRGPRDADPRIVVVAVDDAAVVRAGERTGSGWPLPRRYYARAVRELKDLGAKSIAFDVLFAEPGPHPIEDKELADQCRLAGNVVQACAFQVAEKRTELPLDIGAGFLDPRFSLKDAPLPRIRSAVWASPILPSLSRSAANIGHVNVFPEVSGTLRRVPNLLRWRGRLYPSLALATASTYLGSKPELDVANAQIELAGRNVPLDRDGLTLLNWVGAGGSYPTFGLNQLMDGEVPADAIKGRIVIIGVTALGAFENRANPFSAAVPSVDFQANALDDILSKRLLRSVSSFWPSLLMLLFPPVCALVTARRSTIAFWLLPCMGAALVSLGLWLLSNDIYLPIGVAMLGGLLAFTVTAAGGSRQERDANTRVDAAVSALSRGTTLLSAALGAAGRDRERLLAIIRATARESLDAREVYLLLDDETASDPRAALGSRRAQSMGVGWVWPVPDAGPLRRRRSALGAPAEQEMRLQNELLRGETLVAAPLPRPLAEAVLEGDAPKSRLTREFSGALVAIGRRDGGRFTARDAVLLETLAEGAALALENWQFAETLRGRIESANRELTGAYQLLAEQSAKLFAAVESIDAAIVVSDVGGLAAFVNPAGGRVLRGATPILGEPIVSALAAGDLEELAALFANLQTQGVTANPTHLETSRGSDILSAQFTPLVSDEGQLLGAMMVVSDVTAQRELDRMKTDFVGFVAHELRTPLTTILGYASLLDQAAERFSPHEIRDMTGVISRHCRRMNRMISDLLDISRLESGLPLPLQHNFFDVAPLCARLLEEQKPYLNPTPPFQLVFDCPVSPVNFYGDPDRIEQVVINLLSNSIKYSPEGGEVKISLWQTAEHTYLDVSDEGLGLTGEQLQNLFQKFYRTKEAHARGIKGTGLGLNLVRQIIEAHGGTIEASSGRDEGEKGCTFHVILPGGTVPIEQIVQGRR